MIPIDIFIGGLIAAFVLGGFAGWSIFATPDIEPAPLCLTCRRPMTLHKYPGSAWWARWKCKYCDKKKEVSKDG